MENKPKYTAITKILGIVMLFIGVFGLIALKDAERVARSAWQAVYMVSILFGGICNLLDAGKGAFSLLACFSYIISALSSVVIAFILLGGVIYFVIWIIALFISITRYGSILIANNENIPEKKQSPQIQRKVSDTPIPRQISLSHIDHMEGHDFEYWCADLLRKSGFTRVQVTRGSGDQGVDIIAYKDGKKYAIQCKRYNSKLGNKPVQEVHTGKTIYNCDVAAVMTNNYFTDGAKEAARATGVLLWDRKELERMIKTA